jgi:hypothetical protein
MLFGVETKLWPDESLRIVNEPVPVEELVKSNAFGRPSPGWKIWEDTELTSAVSLSLRAA